MKISPSGRNDANGRRSCSCLKNTTQRRHLEPAFWVSDLSNVDMKQSFKVSIPNGDVGNEYVVIIKRHECHREALFAEVTLGSRMLSGRSPSVTTAISPNNGKRLPPHSPPIIPRKDILFIFPHPI
ncbi:MAG TPA: hypothetical protein VKA34_05120 [Balneolales bacterium]|nr:hypothetical protein [Balneolales bacterium]